MSDDNPFLVDAFFVSHDNYVARKKEIRNLTLELALIAHHFEVSISDYGFDIFGNGKIYQWDPTENDMIYDEQSWMEHYKNLNRNNSPPKKIEKEATEIWEAMYTNFKIPGLTYTPSKNNTTQKMSGKIELHNILTSYPILKKQSLCDAIWDQISVRDNQISNHISENTRLAAELKGYQGQIKKVVGDYNECRKAKQSLQENIEELEKQNEENEKKTELFMKENLELEAENRKDKEKILNQGSQMNNLYNEIETLKNSLHKVDKLWEKKYQEKLAQIDMIQKVAEEKAEKIVKETIDQYQSRFHELKETSDAIIAKLQKEILELKKKNTQNKK